MLSHVIKKTNLTRVLSAGVSDSINKFNQPINQFNNLFSFAKKKKIESNRLAFLNFSRFPNRTSLQKHHSDTDQWKLQFSGRL